jgi:2-polyprenyl-3-methyl-5-hydroxy-6-metoxy-1,4-benzoquinol methylase
VSIIKCHQNMKKVKNSDIKKVIKIYEDVIKDGKSRFELWEKGGSFGSSVTPSTFDKTYLNKITDLISQILEVKNPKILSIGSGNAFIERELAERGCDVLATDVSEQALKLANEKGLKTQYLNAREEFLLKDKFDMVILDGVIGHLVENERSVQVFLEKCKAILNENGIVFIAHDEPINNVPFQEHPEIPSFYWFSKEYLEDVFTESGYTSIKSKYIEYLRPGHNGRRRVIVWGKI